MPQATEELRKKWGGEHGIGDDKATNFLESQGYILTRDWLWIIPNDHIVTDEEALAVMFLIQEWDFGGFAQPIQK